MSLEPTCQAVIQDICHRMGVGMAEFIEKEVLTVEDYDLYCHYVAGATYLSWPLWLAPVDSSTSRILTCENNA